MPFCKVISAALEELSFSHARSPLAFLPATCHTGGDTCIPTEGRYAASRHPSR